MLLCVFLNVVARSQKELSARLSRGLFAQGRNCEPWLIKLGDRASKDVGTYPREGSREKLKPLMNSVDQMLFTGSQGPGFEAFCGRHHAIYRLTAVHDGE